MVVNPTPKKAAPMRRSYSEILRQLLAEANRRINLEKRPDFYSAGDKGKTKAPNQLGEEARLRYWLKKYQEGIHLSHHAEAVLKEMGLAPNDGGKSIGAAWDQREKNEDAWNKRKEARLRQLGILRGQALLNMLDMAPAAAKRYLTNLQKTLEKL